MSWAGLLRVEGLMQDTNVFNAPILYCPAARSAGRSFDPHFLSYFMMLRGTRLPNAYRGSYSLIQKGLDEIPETFVLLTDGAANSNLQGAEPIIRDTSNNDIPFAVGFRHPGQKANVVLMTGGVLPFTFQEMNERDLYRWHVQ